MGSTLIAVPDIADADLLYDEAETRQILEFFWPHNATEIKALEINSTKAFGSW